MSMQAWRDRFASMKGKVNQRSLHVEPIEPRVLLSAEFGAGTLDGGGSPEIVPHQTDDQHDQRLADVARLLHSTQHQSDLKSADPLDLDALSDYLGNENVLSNPALDNPGPDNKLDELQSFLTQTDSRLELVFIDGSTPNHQALLDDVTSGENVNYHVFVLDSESNGISEMSGILANFTEVDAVHIVSHGTDGQVKLGDVWLSGENVEDYAAQFSRWHSFLNADADLLIYGCDLVATDSGKQFVQQLATLASVDVAASEDLTGSLELGGDWELEVNTGVVEAAVPFSSSLQSNWNNVLAAPTSSDSTITIEEDVEYTFLASDFNFADEDAGDELASIQITSLESVGDLRLQGMDVALNQVISKADIDSGLLKFAPVENANGIGYDQFSFSVNDGTQDSLGSSQITLDVTPVNDLPTGLIVLSGLGVEDQTLTVNVSALQDADGLGELSFQYLLNGEPIPGANEQSYLLGDAEVGNSISAVVSYVDGNGTMESVESVRIIEVLNVNDAPVANLDSATTNEDEAISVLSEVGVLSNDSDGDPGDILTITRVTNGDEEVVPGLSIRGDAGGTFRLSGDGSFTFDPGDDFQFLAEGDVAETQVKYFVEDSEGASVSAPLRVAVFGVNDPVNIVGESISVRAGEDQSFSADTGLFANVPGIEQLDVQVISVSAAGQVVGPGQSIQGSGGGTFIIQADGSYAFEAGDDFLVLQPGVETTTSVTYLVSDGQGGTQEATLSIVVVGVTTNGSLPSFNFSTDSTDTEDDEEDAEEEMEGNLSDLRVEEVKTVTEVEEADTPLKKIRVSAVILSNEDEDIFLEPKDSSKGSSGALVKPKGAAGLIGTTDSLLLIGSPAYNNSLDESEESRLENSQVFENIRSGTISVTAGLSIGYVVWLVRSGVVLGSVLSALPAWRLIDPLPILSSLSAADLDEDEESIEDIVQSSGSEIENKNTDDNNART